MKLTTTIALAAALAACAVADEDFSRLRRTSRTPTTTRRPQWLVGLDNQQKDSQNDRAFSDSWSGGEYVASNSQGIGIYSSRRD